MIKNIKIIIQIFLSFGLVFSSELGIGEKMPGIDYPLVGLDGKNITLGDIKGTAGTLVIFSCNTCPWVLKWEDRYVSIASRYLQKGIGIIALNSNVAKFDKDDSLDRMGKHAKKNNYNFPYVQDPKAKLAYAFGATKTPHIYLFNNNDILIYRGAIDDNARDVSKVDEPFLENALDQMLAGEKITKPISKALGCSIKF